MAEGLMLTTAVLFWLLHCDITKISGFIQRGLAAGTETYFHKHTTSTRHSAASEHKTKKENREQSMCLC